MVMALINLVPSPEGLGNTPGTDSFVVVKPLSRGTVLGYKIVPSG